MTATSPHKLAPRSTACVFLGYPSSHKGYRCLDLSTRRIIISPHVVFDESCFPLSSSRSDPMSSLDFLITGHATPVPRRTAEMAPSLAVTPSPSDVEQQRSVPAGLEDDFDNPAVLLRGPVLPAPTAAPRGGPAATRGAPAAALQPTPPTAAVLPPAAAPRSFQYVYTRRPRPPPATPPQTPVQQARTSDVMEQAAHPPVLPPAPAPQAPAQAPPAPRRCSDRFIR